MQGAAQGSSTTKATGEAREKEQDPNTDSICNGDNIHARISATITHHHPDLAGTRAEHVAARHTRVAKAADPQSHSRPAAHGSNNRTRNNSNNSSAFAAPNHQQEQEPVHGPSRPER